VAKDDDIIRYQETLAALPDAHLLSIWPDGGHRFNMHWDKVVTYIQNIVGNE
jgi:hypothetical protein